MAATLNACLPASDLSVYNYWEPLHYLWRNVGFQTWEYSPVYAIRSYFYLLVNASPLVIAQHFASKVRIKLLSFSLSVLFQAMVAHLLSWFARL